MRGRSLSASESSGKDGAMNILFGGSARKRPAAERYLKTASGSVLAFTKMLEAIAAGIGIIMLVFVSEAIAATIIRITALINQAYYFFLPEKIADTINRLIRYPMLIPVLILLLIVLDGIGVLMIRYSGSGDGLVTLVHRISWIRYLIEIIALILNMLRYVLGLDDISQAMGGNAFLFSSLGPMNIFIWLLFFITLIDLLFMCNYHHDICTVLKAVRKERRSETPVNVGKNRLVFRSGLFAFGAGFYFVFSAILFFYPLLTKTNLISDETIRKMTDIPAMVVLAGNLIISLLTFAKYLSLRICAGNFGKVHKKIQE